MACMHTDVVEYVQQLLNQGSLLLRIGRILSSAFHVPRAPLEPARRNALPIFELPLVLEMLEAVVSADVRVPSPDVGLAVPIPLPRAVALVVPRTPRVLTLPRVGAELLEPAVASRCLCSSARRLTSARRRSSSAALRSAAAALAAASLSMSARSCDAPFQDGLRSRRWLCSVCDRMRVQVLRRVEAVFTVLETVCVVGPACISRGASVVYLGACGEGMIRVFRNMWKAIMVER